MVVVCYWSEICVVKCNPRDFCYLCTAILGFHGMLNQVQYHQAFVEGGEMKGCKGGFQGK
jgi:hypothetical protein